MKQTTVTTSKGEFTIVDVPKGATGFDLPEQDFGSVLQFKCPRMWNSVTLSPGSYSLIGSDPLNLTEDEWKDVVHSYKTMLEGSGTIYYKSYSSGGGLDTATASGHSLLTASGHTPGQCVILSKIIS